VGVPYRRGRGGKEKGRCALTGCKRKKKTGVLFWFRDVFVVAWFREEEKRGEKDTPRPSDPGEEAIEREWLLYVMGKLPEATSQMKRGKEGVRDGVTAGARIKRRENGSARPLFQGKVGSNTRWRSRSKREERIDRSDGPVR